MHAIKTSLFAISFVLCGVVTISPEEADENILSQMIAIAEGAKLLFNSTKLVDKFLSSIDDLKKKDAEDNIAFRTERSNPRQEYRCLSREDRDRYHQSMIYLKETVKNGYSMTEYDLIVRIHNSDVAPAAHGGPAFLPWHRHYIHLQVFFPFT